jgi:hypothetical protein
MARVKDMAVSNEGLAIEIKNLSIQIADLKAIMATQAADYIRKEVFELRMREYDTKLAQLALDLAEVDRSTRRANWKTHTLTALFTAVLVTVTLYVVNDLIGR